MSTSADNLKHHRVAGTPARRLIQDVHDFQRRFAPWSDAQLRDHYRELRLQFSANVNERKVLSPLLLESIALAATALERTTGLQPYDVQIVAGAHLARGAILEMQTGEGKTITTLFPAVFRALSGDGVHVATMNPYLARRDFEFLQPALSTLGISAGLSLSSDDEQLKRTAYRCDVTFSTGYDLGFDFLRDQITLRTTDTRRLGYRLRQTLREGSVENDRLLQRGLATAIIDEADSVLIDEAITPLVMTSAEPGDLMQAAVYQLAASVAHELNADEEFLLDRKKNSVRLTEQGLAMIHEFLDSAELEESTMHLARPWKQYIESALRAKHLMARDVHYVVREGKVEMVDEFTGRISADRKWRSGLHQAVECQEGVAITAERKTVARISRQSFFQRYQTLCGMTGTVAGDERELRKCYGVAIHFVPPRKPSQRLELPTRYFSSTEQKINAIVKDSIRRAAAGQPVLIGTRTIAQSRRLSEKLFAKGVSHQLLNGLQDEEEANLIGQAGIAGTITVATNMAGRGTDISPDHRALQAGGLHVIGFERSTSTRIDRQLLGRAGRQGDPGSGQFHVSAEDELLTRYDESFCKKLAAIHSPDGISDPGWDKRVRQIQQAAEQEAYQLRQAVMREELWLNQIKKTAG